MSERDERMTSILKELAAKFIAEEANVPPLITVTKATIAPDYARATIFVTVYPERDELHALGFLKRKGSEFRTYAKKHGHFKVIPFFDFVIDAGERARQELDKIKL